MRSRFAHGRVHVRGVANKTESRYSAHLEARKSAGEILWYRFEGFKVRLADGAFYTPDFAVLNADGALECHEVKAGKLAADGSIQMLCEEASKVRVKVAADMYPFVFLFAIERPKKAGGGWEMVFV